MKPAAFLRCMLLALAGTGVLAGCEAPLNLANVQSEREAAVHRFDHLRAIAASDTQLVAGAGAGVLLVADAGVLQWQRVQLPTRASILSLAACPNGRFVAIDTRHTLWVSDTQAADWQARPVDTAESLMALGCDRHNRVWVGASFSTLLVSEDFGQSWHASSRDEDLQFTAFSFVDDSVFAAGEFGTLMYSDDAQEWQRTEPVPNDFYSIGLHFADRKRGWVCGLGGTVYHTADGGDSWQRQDSESNAPLYNFVTLGERLFVLGDNGALLQLVDGRWRRVANFQPIPTYLVDGVGLADGRLLIAGGGGSLIELQPEVAQ